MDINRMNLLFGSTWVKALGEDYFSSKDFIYLANKVAELREKTTVFPSRRDIFKAFRYTPYTDVKVVILGQDPYHDGSADGLSFSNSITNKISPSLRNILKEVENEFPENKDNISNGRLDPQDLSRWAKQGVLMLNTALTVEKSNAGSHLELWMPFTIKVFQALNNKNDIVWILLGKEAQKFSRLITNKTHTILTASHPASEIYGNGGFFNSGIFRKCNEELKARNKQIIIF